MAVRYKERTRIAQVAVMFLCLAYASPLTKSRLKNASHNLMEVLDREMKRGGAEGWESVEAYLCGVTNAHHWFEIAGFILAAIAAVFECLLALGWR